MATKHCEGCTRGTPLHAGQRRNHIRTRRGRAGRLLRHDRPTATRSSSPRTQQLTEDDHDTSVDLYMWSEQGQLEGKPLTLISLGSGGQGNTDACSASWTSKCDVEMVKGQADHRLPDRDRERRRLLLFAGGPGRGRKRRRRGPKSLRLPEGAVRAGHDPQRRRSGGLTRFRSHPTGPTRRSSRRPSSPPTKTPASPRCTHSTRQPVGRMRLLHSERRRRRQRTSKRASPASSCPMTAGHSSSRRTPWSRKTPTKASDVYEYVEGRPQLISTGRGQIYRRPTGRDYPDHADGGQPEWRRCLYRDLRHACTPGSKTGPS